MTGTTRSVDDLKNLFQAVRVAHEALVRLDAAVLDPDADLRAILDPQARTAITIAITVAAEQIHAEVRALAAVEVSDAPRH